MLILTRKVGETLLINDNIRVSVEKIRGGRVTIGIDAPGDVGILRGELVFDASPGVNEESVNEEAQQQLEACCS